VAANRARLYDLHLSPHHKKKRMWNWSSVWEHLYLVPLFNRLIEYCSINKVLFKLIE
jgi:hypothetical protein